MENRSHALMTGFFTIALVIAAVLAGLWLNRDRSERVPYAIATTQSIPGLNPQAAVRYRGLEVGKVRDIDFNPKQAGQIILSLDVDPETPITTSTFATLGYQGVTGIAYVQLDDDKTGSPAMRSSKERVALIPLRPGFMDQLETRGKAILEQADLATKRAAQLLSPENQKIVVTAIDKFGRIPDQLSPTLERLPGMVQKAENSIARFDDAANKFATLSVNWNKLATDLNAPNGPIERLTRTADRVGDSVEAIGSDIELQTLPHVVAMTDEARSSLRAVKRTVNDIGERPQSILFGATPTPPGPGEPGFTPPAK